jgi:hypothetical protein
MRKVDETSRRTVLTVAASLAAATLGLGVAVADPIFSLIEQHRAACDAHDAAFEDCLRNIAPGYTRTPAEMREVSDAGYAALLVELSAARALDGAATTAGGLRALQRHRAIARHRVLDGWRAMPAA